MSRHDCEDYAVEEGTAPNPAGRFTSWFRCMLCGRKWGFSTDSLL